ncbi:hypothetical protein [Halalkalibacter sp. APA_J-10(15)]|uniref:hypothetical protein n=1 Tax=Halalkalibacter sp. APA_J-10(15) TaxID=2933805 RepID=UPI001FF30EFB|nr:hypothetical protein [Halalkalibacter sp. APA_J-10(15)]MCK0470389.1 hypothetical protein [Halalkalibacter sp. APA_J-10(15)]
MKVVLWTDFHYWLVLDIVKACCWGIGSNLKGETEYIVNRKQGVKLNLRNETVVIEAKKPDEIIRQSIHLKRGIKTSLFN